MTWAQEPEFLLHGRELGTCVGGGLILECLLENMTNPVDIDEIDRERPKTGGLRSCGAVTLCQTKKFLGLTETAPRKLSFE